METTQDHDRQDGGEGERSEAGLLDRYPRAPEGGRVETHPGPIRRRRMVLLAIVVVAALAGGALLAGTDDAEVATPGKPCPAGGRDHVALLRCIRPSLARLETPLATGSGVLVRGRYVLTNAQVVEPFGETTVVFPGGERHDDVPVLGVDFHADVALVGPLDTDRRPLPVVRARPAANADLFLAGYAGDTDDDPEPAISRGSLIRSRRLAEHGSTFFQTDANLANGERGAALVDGDGRVVGIAGLSTDEGRSTIALSGEDTLRSMARIRDGEVPPYRPLPDGPGMTSATLEFPSDEYLFILAMHAGKRSRTVRLTMPPETRPGVLVTDLYGDKLTFVNQDALEAIEQESDEALGVEPDAPVAPGVFEFELPAGSYVRIEVRTRLPEGTSMTLHSTVPFSVLEDLDNDRQVTLGEPVRGVLDPLEVSDTYLMELQAGGAVEIFAGSAYGDMSFVVRALAQGPADQFEVDDSETGLSGLDARGRYEAEVSGTHRIIVESPSWRPTGYVLEVNPAGPPGP